jgi:UDP-N-acetylmuramyl pentapeptide phosphotransferase/UDP-N-acetylglucosamine-1-phosphate transferase
VITWVVLAAVFLAVVAVTPMGIAYAKRTGKLDKPSMRKIHKDPTPSIGGHIFIPAAFIGWWILVPEIDAKVISLTISAAILYIIGIIDDARNLSHRVKLPFQVAASTLVIYTWNLLPMDFGGAFGIHLVHSWWGWLLMLAFFQFTINAINYTDGVNGLLGSYTLISFGFLAWFIQGGMYPHMSPLLLTVAAGVLGFLVFNFRKTARTFMGDTGSTVIGLIAAMTTARIIGKQPQLEITNGTLIPTFFMLVAVFWYPLLDSLQVYVRRLSRGKSPFVADRSHVHHKLLAATDKNHLLVTAIIAGILLVVLGLGVLAL